MYLILLACLLGQQVGSALDVSRNGSECVSNRGLPYSKQDCASVARQYGCLWFNSSCVCENGGTYAKRSHHCWPPEPTTTTTTTTKLQFAADNTSLCRSNSGRPYDQDHCAAVAVSYGCVWRSGACVCSNGGTYAKSSHYCWPPSDPAETTTTTVQPQATTTMATTGSTCVSNRGRPYTKEDCLWIAKEYGCSWINGMCACSNGGTFSKTSKKCWPPSSPRPLDCKDCSTSTGPMVAEGVVQETCLKAFSITTTNCRKRTSTY